MIEKENPADAGRFLRLLDQHIEQDGKAPRQTAAVGDYASWEDLRDVRVRQQVEVVVFHKKRGLNVRQMTRSRWVYRKLRSFRAGIEAGISCLKRAYGMGCRSWKGLAHSRANVWSSVMAHNLALLGRLST